MTEKEYDTVGGIMQYEAGEMDTDEIVELFQHLAASGLVFQLQGHYQRTFNALQQQGLL